MSKDAVYFKSLTLENIKCFKEKQTIDLTNNNGEPAMWTVILGNNNTGKTTLLRSLALLQSDDYRSYFEPNIKDNYIHTPNIITFMVFTNYPNNKSKISSELLRKSPDEIHTKESKWELYVDKGKELKYTKFDSRKIDFDFKMYGYGINRKYNNEDKLIKNLTEKIDSYKDLKTLFNNNAYLINAEEWLIQTDYAAKKKIKNAEFRLNKIKDVLINILIEFKDFKFVTDEQTFATHVEVLTNHGWMTINNLGYASQSLLAWVIDLAKKMFDRYPDSDNPLHEPAIVLVDEIDLHLHPEWQRKIVAYLSKNFPKTQFIVTSHSPLVVQSADEVNVVVLKKDGDNVKIEQPKIENFQGWTVEEILRDLMDLDERTHSETYIQLRKDFEAALEEDNFAKAKTAKDKLDKILHPNSTQRKILEIQMTSLTPELSVN